MEETHNTLKFASRAKRVEIYASRNKVCLSETFQFYGTAMLNVEYWLSCFQIIDEKSLIKKYQKEISCLKQELDQLRRGMLVGVNHEELMTLKQQVRMQVKWFGKLYL